MNPSTSRRISEAAGDQGLQERRHLRAAVPCVTAPDGRNTARSTDYCTVSGAVTHWCRDIGAVLSVLLVVSGDVYYQKY